VNGEADASGCVRAVINGGRTRPLEARHGHYRSLGLGRSTTEAVSAPSLLNLHTKYSPQLVAATSGPVCAGTKSSWTTSKSPLCVGIWTSC
jgi:hypothetical protein